MSGSANQTFRGKLSPDLQGTRFFRPIQTTTDKNSTKTLLTEIVPSGKQIKLMQVDVSCRTEGIYRIKINSDVIASGRTAAGNPNTAFSWVPFHEAASGDTISVEYESLFGRSSTDIEVYLQGRDVET